MFTIIVSLSNTKQRQARDVPASVKRNKTQNSG